LKPDAASRARSEASALKMAVLQRSRNVIVYNTYDKKSYVAVFNPVSALGILQSEKLTKIAEEVSEKLQKVVKNL
jgi:hypothetical protein